ncbi:MAG: integration host factor subunit beta [Deltaproteobacteria bacterium]|nr:integration host factor subunit beta [Deltaproteobacteria bacterium]
MNKSELIEKLAQRNDISLQEAEDIVGLILREMQEALRAGKRIEIRGFGSFVVKDYGSYWGRNPKTGEKIWVTPKRLPAFKLGKELKDRLKENGLSV